MTPRAIILGLLSAAAVCGFCYFNDFVMRQTFLVGNYMPISVYGGLLAFIIFVNPLLLKMSKRLALSGRELSVIVMLTLAACYVPGRGLCHYFTTFMMMPHHFERTNPGWKQHGIVEMAPPVMLAAAPPQYRPDDVTDPLAFYAKLTTEGPKPEPSPSRTVWQHLSEEARATARQALEAARADAERYATIAEALETVVRGWALQALDGFADLELPKRAKEMAEGPHDALSAEDKQWLGRVMFETAYPKTVATHKRDELAVTASDVLDWPAFCTRLQRQASRSGHNPGKLIWEMLPEQARQLVADTVAAAREAEQRNALLVAALNEIIAQPRLYRNEAFRTLALAKEGETLLARVWDGHTASQLLEHAFGLAAAADPAARQDKALAANALLEQASHALADAEYPRLHRHLLDAAFPKGLRTIGATDDLVLNGFLQGLGVGSEHIAPSQIPWFAWTRALAFWVALLLSFSIGVIGLALVVHRQWSAHEHLPYPIITFAHALLPEEGKARGGVFRSRMFWIAALSVVVVHLNNYGVVWWPRYMIPIQRQFNFQTLRPLFPMLQRGGDYGLLNPTLYFTAIGFAYFLATDVSLALGIAPFVYAWAAGVAVTYGVTFGGGGFISLKIETFLYGGAYFGMFLVLLYTGRHYYLTVLRRSLCLPGRGSGAALTAEDAERREDECPRSAVWGARVFLMGIALFVVQLVHVGLPAYLAIAYALGAVLIFTVISRVVAETGVFFIHAYHFPCVLLWGFLGARALGPRPMLIMFMVTAVLLIDPRESVMPFFVQGLKLIDLNRVKLGRTAVAGSLALVVGFAVAVPATLYWQYDRGVNRVSDGWCRGVPRMAYDATVRAMERMDAQGTLEEAGKQTGLDWLRSISPNTECMVAFGATFALVLLFSAGRLRFPRWPVHPVLFLVLGTWQSRMLGVSFLIGWLVKLVVTKYGGAAAYQRLKPLMIGVIAGDMLGGLVPMAIGAIYYWATGEPPKLFRVLPT